MNVTLLASRTKTIPGCHSKWVRSFHVAFVFSECIRAQDAVACTDWATHGTNEPHPKHCFCSLRTGISYSKRALLWGDLHVIRFAKAEKDDSNLCKQNLRNTHQMRDIKDMCATFPANQIYLFQAKLVPPPPSQTELPRVEHSLFLSRGKKKNTE